MSIEYRLDSALVLHSSGAGDGRAVEADPSILAFGPICCTLGAEKIRWLEAHAGKQEEALRYSEIGLGGQGMHALMHRFRITF